jgi:hypothetical protein
MSIRNLCKSSCSRCTAPNRFQTLTVKEQGRNVPGIPFQDQRGLPARRCEITLFKCCLSPSQVIGSREVCRSIPPENCHDDATDQSTTQP